MVEVVRTERRHLSWQRGELGIHVITLYKWRKIWRLQGDVVPASQKDPEGWGRPPPRFQERCHPFDQYTRGLEDMTNASLQRGCKG